MIGRHDTLNEAFAAAKRDRDVLSKQIVWESGIGKSQFYRIISGKESPGLETKRRISDALNIDVEEFERLHSQARLEAHKNTQLLSEKDKRAGISQKGFAFTLLVVLLIGLSALIARQVSTSKTSSDIHITADANDTTLFIKDVTIPDGTPIPINTKFVKTWRVKNVGDVVWKDRYLRRVTPQSELLCSSPDMVPIPETKPGQTVDISVTFETPPLPGSCRTDWKSSDKNGNLHFPDKHGLFSIVTVTK